MRGGGAAYVLVVVGGGFGGGGGFLSEEENISRISLAAGLILGSSLRQASTISLKYFGMLSGNGGSAMGSA